MQFIKSFLLALWTPFKLLVTAPQKLIATPKKLMGLSLPARIAILVAIFEVIGVTAMSIYVVYSGQWSVSQWLVNLPVIAILVLVIPAVIYQALKLWLEGEASAHEDIDRAWRAGLAELERQGLDLQELPLFLVLGSSGEVLEKALFTATGQDYAVTHFPAGPSALRWYAGAAGVVIVATEVGCLSKVATLARSGAEGGRQEMGPSGGGRNIRGTLMEPQQARRTAIPGGGGGSGAGGGGPAPARRPGRLMAALRGTMMAIRGTSDRLGAVEEEASTDDMPASAPRIDLRTVDREHQKARLTYLARLLRRGRQPLCPVNGVLALLPYGVFQRIGEDAGPLVDAVVADTDTLTKSLELRMPVTILVTGMEAEPGFAELVGRFPAEVPRQNRFGKGFGVWWKSTNEQMEALGFHACNAFETWIYELFKRGDSLSQAGNKKLYLLLCKIRRDLQPRLDRVLAGGFGYDPDRDQSTPPLLIVGCYFAATGAGPSQQAFVASVFEKMTELEEELEWTPSAVARAGRYRGLSRLMWAVDGLLAVGLAYLVYTAMKK